MTLNRSEVIYITIANGISISAGSEWKVSSEVSMSDHKRIRFNVDLDKKKMKKRFEMPAELTGKALRPN